MDQKWTKYTYVCSTCDGLFEMTITSHRTIDQSLCPSCFNTLLLLSVEDATINNNNEQKEEAPMNATTEFMQARIAELESQLKSHQNCDYWKSENGRIGSQIIALIDNSYDEDLSSDEIITELCQIVDYNPTKTVEFTATMTFSGSIEVPREEQNDFDLTAVLEDAYVDINNGNVVIDSYELYDANEC